MKIVTERIGILSLFLLAFQFLLLIAFLFFVGSSFMILKRNIEDERGNFENSSHIYKYFEKDYSRNKTAFGVVSLLTEIDQFVSYHDHQLRKSVVISPFGTEEYECIGSCYCESEEKRRIANSGVLVEGVSYLLAAVSSVVALRVAKEYFEEQCTERYSHACESRTIKYEVPKCEKVVSEVKEETTMGKNKQEEKRVYFCYGNCMDNLKLANHGNNRFRPTAKESGFDCRKMKREGEVAVFWSDLIQKTKSQSISTKFAHTALHRFQQQFLVEYCKESSKIEYSYPRIGHNTLKSGEKKETYTEVKRMGSMCIGIRDKKGESQLQNVKCRQVDPTPTDNAAKWRDFVFWEAKEAWDKI